MKDRVVINRNMRRSIPNNRIIESNVQNKQQSMQVRNMSQSYFDIVKREKEVYKRKHEEVQTKCQLLQRIIYENGLGEQIPNTFMQELSITSKRIRQIQDLITEKNHSSVKILQKQILIFLKDIGFQVPQKVFQKITTQIEMINFILQLFSHRYQQLMEEKQTLQKFIKQFRQSQQSNEKYYQRQSMQMKMEIEEILKRYREQQQEAQQLRRQLEQRAYYEQTELKDSFNLIENNCQQLQKQNKQLKAQLQQANQNAIQRQLQLRQLRSDAEDLEAELQQAFIKIQLLENQLAKMQREEVRSKQRMDIVLTQKVDRIKVLEKMLNDARGSSHLITQSEQDYENRNRDSQMN